MEYAQILVAIGMGVIAFIGWLIREKFTDLYNLERRTTALEAKLNVLGDINEVLGTLKTDVAVIKNSIESRDKQGK